MTDKIATGMLMKKIHLQPSAFHPVPFRGWFDRAGVWASTACMLHCLLTPLLLSFSILAAHFLSSKEHTHRALAIGFALIGLSPWCAACAGIAGTASPG